MSEPRIIVSLTSFPARIHSVYRVIDNILSQTRKPDRILLWLAESQFPEREKNLPGELMKETERGLEIRWCRDLRPHKKYLYAMKEFPEDILITVDDDLVYPDDMIDVLYQSYVKHPRAVSAMRTHILLPKEEGGFYPYSLWLKECDYLIGEESVHLFATNGAGSLFPPHILSDKYLDEDLIMELCPTADDLWLKAAEILEGVPTVLVRPIAPLEYLEGTQDVSLEKDNVRGENDVQWAKIVSRVKEESGEDLLYRHLMHPACGVDLHTPEHVLKMGVYERNKWKKEAKRAQRERDTLRNDKSELDRQLRLIRSSNAYKTAVRMRSLVKGDPAGFFNADKPLVSVIIPVYNASRFLRENLDSILGQTLAEIEVICVDDGSTDDSRKILEEYQKEDRRLKILTQKNQGAGAARNHGMKEAKGKYLLFLDADDFFERDLAEKCAVKAEKENTDVLVFAADYYDDREKRFTPAPWGLKWQDCPKETPFSAEDMKDHLFQSFQNWTWNKLFRRSFVAEHGISFQEVKRGNDVAFVSSALANAKRISYLNEVFAHYRVNSGSSLQQTKDKDPLGFFEAYRELKRRFVHYGKYELFEHSFLNKLLRTVNFYALTYKTDEARAVLAQFLRETGDEEFGISIHPEEYYYNKSDYRKYFEMIGK
ncbi:MAG: glycosyltransferase [Erysipelotrichaceae bacterium]|nr:glycosyltransferase [Erysipelotrichaceae bacterium]